MTIIKIDPTNDNHPIESQSHRTEVWIDGYIEVPKNLESAAWDSGGYCNLDIQGGVLVGITPAERPEPEIPAMTVQEAALDMMSNIDYRLGLLELAREEVTV